MLVALIVGTCSMMSEESAVSASNDTSYDLSFSPRIVSTEYRALQGLPGNVTVPSGAAHCSDELPGLERGKCGDEALDFKSLANVMSSCSIAVNVSCISGLEIKLEGVWYRANFLGPAPVTPQCFRERCSPRWSAKDDLDLGPSSYAAVFGLDSVRPELNLWVVSISYEVLRRDLESPGNRSYQVVVRPVTRLSPYTACWVGTIPSIGPLDGIGDSSGCYKTLEPTGGFEVRLSLDLKYRPVGWVSTYLQDATATSTFDAGRRRFQFQVSGAAVRIPTAFLKVAYSDVEKRERLCSTYSHRTGFCDPGNRINMGIAYNTLGGQGFPPNQLFKTFAEKVVLFPELDRAVSEQQFWVFAFSTTQSAYTERCAQPFGIYGVSGGNSMLISTDVPTWNSLTKTLEFSVASPHYRPNGDVAQGFYEMQLNQQVANCLWGTTVTPANVSLSVLDDKGDAKVATATVGVQNGMVVFRAAGFTFSSTTLRASYTPTLSATPNKRIRCTKNGVTRLQPRATKRCPSGWKRA
jgi:hypothetical protein